MTCYDSLKYKVEENFFATEPYACACEKTSIFSANKENIIYHQDNATSPTWADKTRTRLAYSDSAE